MLGSFVGNVSALIDMLFLNILGKILKAVSLRNHVISWDIKQIFDIWPGIWQKSSCEEACCLLHENTVKLILWKVTGFHSGEQWRVLQLNSPWLLPCLKLILFLELLCANKTGIIYRAIILPIWQSVIDQSIIHPSVNLSKDFTDNNSKNYSNIKVTSKLLTQMLQRF